MVIYSLRTVFLVVAGAAFLLAGCTTNTTGAGAAQFNTTGYNVDPDMARACVIASANKYYLPMSVIKAIDARRMADSSMRLTMRVDLRSAICTISPTGGVQSVVDTTPKSADQAQAERNAARQQKPV